MIQIILRLISQGNTSIGEIATKLHITKEELLKRFEIMETMGYLEKTDNSKQKNISHVSNSICSLCPVSKSCTKSNSSIDGRMIYTLSEKGKRLAKVKQ